MDRQAWIAVTICVLGLVGWQVYMSRHAPQVVTPPTVALSPSPSATEAAPLAPAPTPAAVPPAESAATPAAESFAEKTEVIANGDIELRLTNRGGGVSEAHLLKHTADTPEGHVVLNSREHLPIGAIIEHPTAPALAEFTMARQPDGSVQLERAEPQGLAIRKRFALPQSQDRKDNYLAEMQVEFRNDGTQPYTNPGYYFALGATAPLHPRDIAAYTRAVWCIDGKPKAIDVSWFAASNYPLIGVQKRAAQKFYDEGVNGAEWGAVSNQFFTTILTPLNAKANRMWAQRFEIPQENAASLWGMESAMGMPGFTLQPGQTSSLTVQMYSGPKLYHELAKLGHDEAEIMNFGFFKLVSQALLNFLNLIHGWVKSYGVAIILLTACVKGVLWPLQNAANRSMRKMSALAPRMQALKEKYKDDPTRMNTEVMKLYKEHGVNPVGGCLPMMIQIPIFFGLFSMLGQAAELRNAGFLWVHDLSQPDTIAHLPGIGWPINILPLLMGATNVWLMRMTPKTGDTTQQRVMMFMPIIFLIFCYNFAAALALYYTTQNLFTILQLWQNQRQPVPVLEKPAPVTKRSKKGARS
ncbi:MAG: membrane protein insertase YidC [Verrucomicrobiota bacterium]|nr:membrane protein insertase YidC [Verrucomicrobiota bacterium]